MKAYFFMFLSRFYIFYKGCRKQELRQIRPEKTATYTALNNRK